MTEKTEVPEKSATKFKRLTSRQLAEAETLYAAGEITLEGLATKFGRHRETFVKHFQKIGLKKGSAKEEHKKEVAEEVKKAAFDTATITATRIRETKEEHYKMAMGLAKLTWKEILNAKIEARPISTAINNLKALDAAMNVLAKARNERYAVLGLDRDDSADPDSLTELIITELTADQIEEIRNRQEEDGLDMSDLKLPDLDGADDEDDVIEES